MPRIIQRRPSPALVVACLALLFALTGTSIAAVEATVPNNSVGTNQLKNNAVVAAKIKSNAVTAAKIASNAVASAKIAGNAVNSAKVANGTLLKEDFKDGELPAPTAAFARFLNGPIVVPTTSTLLASLAIPAAGSYVIFAKAYVTAAALAPIVNCRLEAGGDVDISQASPTAGAPETIALNAVHVYSAAGTADLRCDGSVVGASANFIKITAIQVGSVTNSG